MLKSNGKITIIGEPYRKEPPYKFLRKEWRAKIAKDSIFKASISSKATRDRILLEPPLDKVHEWRIL